VNTETKVGIFVVVCVLILGSTIIALITPQLHSSMIPYHTYLRYAGGLAPGGNVLFGGIVAGRITGVRPAQSDPTRIEISVELKPGTPVNEKSVAKIGSVGLMSEPALLISTGSNAANRISSGKTIPSQEAVTLDEIAGKLAIVTENANTLITQVQGELGDISADARKLLANLNSMTGQPNQQRVARALDQLNGVLSDQRPKLNRISDHLLDLSQHADELAVKLGPMVDHADGTIQNFDGMLTDVREPLQSDVVELQQTLAQAKSVLASMQVLIKANDYKIDDTVENLRVTTENLNELTDSLKQRPWSLIRIKQPKERQVP
jgi:phospholipid/cholesterol/gamma-HCH transport system substrate-binding protein